MKKHAILFIFLIFASGCEVQNARIDDYNMAIQAMEQRDWSLASRLGQRILLDEILPEKRWNAWQVVVNASKNMGDFNWAISSLETMAAEFLEAEHQEYINKELIDVYSKVYQYEKAILACMRLLEKENMNSHERSSLELQIAEFSIKINDFFVAEDMLLACLGRENSVELYNECLYLLANVYYLSDKYEKAFEVINTYLALENTSEESKALFHFMKGDLLEIQGNTVEALKEFYTAYEYHPNPGVVEVRLKNLQK